MDPAAACCRTVTPDRIAPCLALAGALTLMACQGESDALPDAAQPLASPVARVEPDAARLLERANDRWARIAAKDWVAAYEYVTPEQRETMPLDRYLRGKQGHEYSHPRVEGVPTIHGCEAYTQVLVRWQPVGNCKMRVRADPVMPSDDEATLDVEIVESWSWRDKEWFFVRAQRPEEFFEEHAALR